MARVIRVLTMARQGRRGWCRDRGRGATTGHAGRLSPLTRDGPDCTGSPPAATPCVGAEAAAGWAVVGLTQVGGRGAQVVTATDPAPTDPAGSVPAAIVSPRPGVAARGGSGGGAPGGPGWGPAGPRRLGFSPGGRRSRRGRLRFWFLAGSGGHVCFRRL